jgi:Ca2+-binding EF-hand superfamily protein
MRTSPAASLAASAFAIAVILAVAAGLDLFRTEAAGREAPGGFSRLDANGDGSIERKEADAASDARFERADANDDGRITREEIRAAHGQRQLERLDENKDGAVSLPELENAAKLAAGKRFERLDANGDGRLLADELAAARPPGGAGRAGGARR